ncbi:MAG TPA: DUF5752 family protein [bacterium]|jgi:hypothetical protein
MPEPFAVKDCALIAIATGRHARNLRELAGYLSEVPLGSIYHHFWGGRLHTQFDEPEFQNDFAGWVRHALHDEALSERLGMLDPTRVSDLEALRVELLDILDESLNSLENPPWAQADQPFSFVRSQLVIFDTQHRIAEPAGLKDIAPGFTVGTIFYHFIDARRRRPEGIDDFRGWLLDFGEEYKSLIDQLAAIDPYFRSLAELKDRLSTVFQTYFGG